MCFLRPINELQNSCATPPIPALCLMENKCPSFPKLAPFLEDQIGVWSWRREKQVSGRTNLLCCPQALSLLSSPLPFPPFSSSSEDAAPLWLRTASKGTPGGWGFTDHNNLRFIALSEQDKMSLPCTAALQRAALKSKIMGKKLHPPRLFLPCLNETSN